MDAQYRHLPQSPSPHTLPRGFWTDRLTQTHSIAEAFDATCSLEACQPAHLLRPLAKVHTQPGILAWHHRSRYLRTHRQWWEGGGSPWFLSWEILIRCFLLEACIGERKESRKLNNFFCFGNWVWHVLLSKCYPFKHFRGKLVLPASISIMWRAMFSPAPLLMMKRRLTDLSDFDVL